MKLKARSGILIWITTLALLTCTVAFATTYNEFDRIGGYLLILIILAASTVLTASFILRNHLIVDEQTIKVCFGITTTVVKTASVTSLKKVKDLTASASASARRIEIRYDRGSIYVSPKDEETFIKTVCSYNPNVQEI